MKTGKLPKEANSTMAKLETWAFAPALSFMSMSTYFTIETISSHAINISLSIIVVAISVGIAIPLSTLFVKNKCYEKYIFQYALAFSNLGYMADPLVDAMFPNTNALAYYKIFCLPFTIVIYIWGITILTPEGNTKGNPIKRLINPPIVAMLLGVVVGLTGFKQYIPEFILSALNGLKSCMGPVAMLLAGATIANYDLKRLITNKKTYFATLLRLLVLPPILVGIVVLLRHLLNLLTPLTIGLEPVYFTFFATAMPLGMNTIIFPEAYGGDPEPGASMAMISSTFAVVTIPLLYSLLTVLFPGVTFQ